MADRPFIVLGAGGHAKVVIDTLQLLGHTVIAAVEKDEPAEPRFVLGVPVHGEALIDQYQPDEIYLALGIGA